VYKTVRLRTKFLLSLMAITAGLTAATLSVVSYSVERRIRTSLRQELRDSVNTYQTFEQQRESTLVRSAELLANLPTVRALMTTEDVATIQDESANIWKLSGSDLLVLANRAGEVVGLQSRSQGFTREKTQELMRAAMQKGDGQNWWFSDGHLYEVWLQPIYFGAAKQNSTMGVLAVGHEIDDRAAGDFSKIVSSDIVVRCSGATVATTLPGAPSDAFSRLASLAHGDAAQEIQVGHERYLVSTVSLSSPGDLPVTLSVLKSLDKATEFLSRLNRILLGLGLLSVVIGGVLVFLISHTFTRPLSSLVVGVRALEEGNYNHPLEKGGDGEVGEVTKAFGRMRATLKTAQEEQKLLEERLRQAHKMEAVGRLAGGVAHDFNNLLTVIRGNTDLLLDSDKTDRLQHRYLEQIQKAGDRAVSMTRQLLAFSRMQVLQPRVLDLNLTISEMNKMLPRLIGEHIEFSFLPEPALATVLADPGQIEQVFLNLAVNARDAMPEGGKLTVRTKNLLMDPADAARHQPMPPGSYVLLAVSDTGHGMDAETKARIFEPFFTTKEFGKGTGLGLATVYGIVKQSGGFIWVESSLGAGATFEIYLPCSGKLAENGNQPAAPISIPRGSETILLAEDETGVRELASEFLIGAGYTVLVAADGAEALNIAAKHPHPIHLLLTDMVMPRMGGVDLAERLWQVRPETRAVFMTGYAEFPTKNDNAFSIDACVLQKPFSRLTLLEKIREVLRAAPRKHPGKTKIEGPAEPQRL
jgi:signal transduction histidine kinase/ActR/RegA family two-component response regulator